MQLDNLYNSKCNSCKGRVELKNLVVFTTKTGGFRPTPNYFVIFYTIKKREQYNTSLIYDLTNLVEKF